MNNQGVIVHWLPLEGAGKFSILTRAPFFPPGISLLLLGIKQQQNIGYSGKKLFVM